jgi:ankyrin repeat protein
MKTVRRPAATHGDDVPVPRRRRLVASIGALLAIAFADPLAAQAGKLDDLFVAASANDAATVRRLLDAGYDVNSTDPRGFSLLMIAAREGAADVVRLVASRRPRIDQRNSAGETALLIGAIRGNAEVVRALLEAGASQTGGDWSPLHYAAAGGHEAVVKLLIARGAEIDARSPNGTTPLMMAVRAGHVGVVRQLLFEVADPNARNDADMTPLAMAQRIRNAEIEKLLRQAGAKP